ncbi:MAG: DEAD/DEAH box helicase [Colwellia sp.]|nr:DEAD/DEAH box helicase [Colwellia sp.]
MSSIQILNLAGDYTLFPHQQDTLDWMAERMAISPVNTRGVRGGIIALEQGLGKTLIALYRILSTRLGDEAPSLVIAKKSIMPEWKACVERFFPNEVDNVLYFHSDFYPSTSTAKGEMENMTRDKLMSYKIIITTYEVCTSACNKNKKWVEDTQTCDDNGRVIRTHKRSHQASNLFGIIGKSVLYSFVWSKIFVDESHEIANNSTAKFKAVLALTADEYWCLSGTPIRNYVTDFLSQLQFLGYDTPEVNNIGDWKKSLKTGILIRHALTKNVFQMNYEQAGIVLPEKIIHEHYLDFSENERQIYDVMTSKIQNVYNDCLGRLTSFVVILALLTRLRQICNAAFTITPNSKRHKIKNDNTQMEGFTDTLDSEFSEWVFNQSGTAGVYSTKIMKTVDILSSTLEDNPFEKIIIFTSFVAVVDLIHEAITTQLEDVNCCIMEGSVKGRDRITLLDQFRNDPSIQVLIMTYKVGSEGLNLVEASTVILQDFHWNEAQHLQSVSRVHRMGQKREVNVHKIIINDSIEQRILQICHNKNEMSKSILNGTFSGGAKQEKMGMDLVGKLLGFNTNQ